MLGWEHWQHLSHFFVPSGDQMMRRTGWYFFPLSLFIRRIPSFGSASLQLRFDARSRESAVKTLAHCEKNAPEAKRTYPKTTEPRYVWRPNQNFNFKIEFLYLQSVRVHTCEIRANSIKMFWVLSDDGPIGLHTPAPLSSPRSIWDDSPLGIPLLLTAAFPSLLYPNSLRPLRANSSTLSLFIPFCVGCIPSRVD